MFRARIITQIQKCIIAFCQLTPNSVSFVIFNGQYLVKIWGTKRNIVQVNLMR